MPIARYAHDNVNYNCTLDKKTVLTLEGKNRLRTMTYLNTTGLCNVWKSYIGGPSDSLYHVFMTSQLSLALFGRGHPYSNSL